LLLSARRSAKEKKKKEKEREKIIAAGAELMEGADPGCA